MNFESLPIPSAEISLVFDREFYCSQAGVDLDPSESVRHYLMIGELSGLWPSPMFDPAHVAAQWRARDREPGPSILLDYLAESAEIVDPHPLFDSEYYRSNVRGETGGDSDLVDFARRRALGQRRVSPHPLFDADFYCERYGDVTRSGLDAFQHYIVEGRRAHFQPHPLFDLKFWRAALRERGVEVAPDGSLLDYVTRRETWIASTHPLFDPDHYADRLRRLGLAADPRRPPLADLLTRSARIAPHYLFDPEHYRRQAEIAGVEIRGHPLRHYAANPRPSRFDPHPLFDESFYAAQVPEAAAEPAAHYLSRGWRDGRDPSPLFSVRHYRTTSSGARRWTADPIAHYLERGGKEGLDPHPFFDSRWYRAHAPDAAEAPLVHFLRSWIERGVECPPWGTHFEPRHAAVDAPAPYDVVVVSHELTLTGAPLILLRIVEELSRRFGLRVLTLAARGGPLREAFAEWADVVVLSDILELGLGEEPMMQWLVDALHMDNRPRLAIVNTACVPNLGAALDAAGIPVLTLVHELASAFPRDDFRRIFEASRFVVFPARFVLEEAQRTHPFPAEAAIVIPQGLLDSAFGEGDAMEARRALLEEIGAPEDAFVVLGCGTLDLRKGVDVFARVATAAVRSAPAEAAGRPLYFVWIGGGPNHAHSPVWYAEQDIARAGLSDRVTFLGVRPEPQGYFLGCDAFALTSRMDPFPCVVHEAMACGKPIVAFANSGGAPEALAAGAGVVVGYGDAEAMARALRELADDPARRAEIGELARRRVRDVYSFPAYVEKILEAVRERIGLAFERRAGPPDRGRLIFTLGGADPDPHSTFVMRLARELRVRGFRSEVVFTGNEGSVFDASPPPGTPTRWLRRDSRESASFLERARRLESGFRAAAPAVYAHGPDLLGSAVAPVAAGRIGCLGLVYDGRPEALEQAVRLGRYWQRAVATPRAATALRRAVPEIADRAVVIASGAPDAATNRPPRDSGPLLAACAWHARRPEDWREFARLFADPRATDAPSHVLVVPHAPGRTRPMEAALAEWIAAGTVRLATAANCDDFVRQLARCDVLLAASDATMPIEIAEAMKLELVAILVARGPASRPPEAFRDGENGFWIGAGAPERAREALAELAAEPERLARMRSAALAGGREASQDWETVVDRYCGLLEDMFEAWKSGSCRRPEPPWRHPRFGGLSFPSPLRLDPDADFASDADRDTSPGWTQFGWKTAVAAEDDREPEAERARSLLQIGVPAPSSRLMLQVEASATAPGSIVIRSQTDAEDEFHQASALVAPLRRGPNVIRALIRRNAPIGAIRVEPESADRSVSLRSARLFAPAGESPPPPLLSHGLLVDCALDGDGERYLVGSWYPPEPSLRWSQAGAGEIGFLADFSRREPLRLWTLCRVTGTRVLGAIEVRVCLPDDAEIAVWTFADEDWRWQSVRIDPPVRGATRAIRLRLARDAAPSPHELGIAADGRELGVAIRRLGLFSVETAEAQVAALARG